MTKLQRLWSITAIAASLLMPGYAWAQERTSTGYLSSVTSKSIVMDGVAYRFRSNQEEKNPIKVECVMKDKKIGCEELAPISQRNRAKAKILFDRAGDVIRVQILDVLE